MKNTNYITIQGWMVNELCLSGNELLCYALVYGFSQDEESCFKGSRKYIAKVIGAGSLNTVDRILKTLIDKKLILKDSTTINGVIFNTYKINAEHPYFKNGDTCSKNEYPCSKNEYDNNSNIDSDKEEKDKSFSKKEQKDELFEQCWKEYRRKGAKSKAKNIWDKLTKKEKEKIIPHIKAYVTSRELQFQQDFERYLKNKTFESLVISNNNVLYDPSRKHSSEYRPQCDGISLFWNEMAKCYITPFDIETLMDGYNSDNRPNGALVMWRGYKYEWNNKSKNWNIKND